MIDRLKQIDTEFLILGFSYILSIAIGFYFFPWMLSELWGLVLVVTFIVCCIAIGDDSFAVAIIVLILTPITCYVVTSDHYSKLFEQKSFIAEGLQPIIETAKKATFEVSQFQQSLLRPYIILTTSLELNSPNLEKVTYKYDAHLLGDLAVDIDLQYRLLDKKPDFNSVRSVILVAETWEDTGRLIELDRGEVPELVHNLRLFLVDLETQRIVWSSGPVRGDDAPPELKGGGPGRTYRLDHVKGPEVEWSEIEKTLEQIPWE